MDSGRCRGTRSRRAFLKRRYLHWSQNSSGWVSIRSIEITWIPVFNAVPTCWMSLITLKLFSTTSDNDRQLTQSGKPTFVLRTLQFLHPSLDFRWDFRFNISSVIEWEVCSTSFSFESQLHRRLNCVGDICFVERYLLRQRWNGKS